MPPPPPPQRGLSILSTDTEASETMLKLLSDANKRIAQYAAQGRQDEDKLKQALQAFLEWLPDVGKVSIARDILGATTDDLLHQVFFNLFTTLAVPMKTRSHAGSVKCSPHPHRLDAEEAVASTLDDPLEREKFRDDSLRKDDYCCVVSGDMDVDKFCERGTVSELNKLCLFKLTPPQFCQNRNHEIDSSCISRC
ncbi:hypothetical protein AnigIFM50267_004298 [Aspergillus niger]|nr:hypothetical protein AnigIFM50267_004298 [Aspergillus niger]